MPTVTCRCKEVYHANDEHIGKQIQCRKCGRKLKIVAERKRRTKKEPRPRTQRVGRASARSAPPPGNPGESYDDGRQHLDPKMRLRLMIASGVLFLMSALLALQIFRSLHALPNQPSAPEGDTGMVSPPTAPLPGALAARAPRIRFVTT